MKIAIIGAGFTGLAAAYVLTEKGHEAVVYEKDSDPGGLAIGYSPARNAFSITDAGGEKEWQWSLEKHYHHCFTNDNFILDLAKAINHPVIIRRPHTNWYVKEKIYAFDSLFSALTFPRLPLTDRIRNLFVLGILRINPFWKPLEKINATTFLPKVMGIKAYKTLWEPLFINKFGSYASDISLAWFWARIKKRTQSLAYPKGGFLQFAKALTQVIEEKGAKVHFNTEIIYLNSEKNPTVTIKDQKGKETTHSFDKVIVTTPSFLFVKIAPQLPESYKQNLNRLKGLGAINLVLRLKKPFFNDNTYWLSIADNSSPIMAIVEHTNFMDKKYYNNEHLVYLGNYLSHDHKYFTMEKEKILALYDPFLKKINPDYKKSLIAYELFKAPFAQPVIPINYSKIIPSFETPLKNVFLANMQQVYPWDRGTNYAVELGEKIAKFITNEEQK